MVLEDFLRKHPIDLTNNERQVCDEAIEIMKRAIDVHHDHTHIFRMLDFVDEFMESEEFKKIASRVDLKILFIAIVCHDLWRSKKDAHTGLQLLWYMFLEHWGGPKAFRQLSRGRIDQRLERAMAYAIGKHSHFIIIPPRTLEARMLKAIDEVDYYSDERIALLEKKFLLDRPITSYYLKQAKLAVRLYIKADTAPTHYFSWIKARILSRKQYMIERLNAEIAEYAVLLRHKQESNTQAYQEQFQMMKAKFNL